MVVFFEILILFSFEFDHSHRLDVSKPISTFWIYFHQGNSSDIVYSQSFLFQFNFLHFHACLLFYSSCSINFLPQTRHLLYLIVVVRHLFLNLYSMYKKLLQIYLYFHLMKLRNFIISTIFFKGLILYFE